MAAGYDGQPHYPAPINVPVTPLPPPPLIPAQSLLRYEPLVTEPASLLLAMPVPPRFFIYLSTTSANCWRNPLPHPPLRSCRTHLAGPHPPTRLAHPSQAPGGLALIAPPT